MPIGCCGCCSALRPRYKRLVDNIFPVNPEDGLVRGNMDKLTFYSMSSPEKLDRIGEYLAQRVSRDIYRHRYAYVMIAMEAMDQLLVACHAQSLNLFVESFLKTVQKLLESAEPTLQTLASQSFVKFANIEEPAPSYHRRYDFFVSQFAMLCFNQHVEVDVRDRLRIAGLEGIQGVVRKTVSDELAENIWRHMDKIVPPLLYNMQTSTTYLSDNSSNAGLQQEEQTESDSLHQKIEPSTLAENCLREVAGRASFNNIEAVIKPVFDHFDHFELWVPNDFAIYTFRVVMFSIQVKYLYAVVEILMSKLNKSSHLNALVRTSMADVLSKILTIATVDSLGTSVLEITSKLVDNLNKSVLTEIPVDDIEAVTHEKLYQESLINALAEFAYRLPHYQGIEIMKFIIARTPGTRHSASDTTITPAQILLQHMLLKCVVKVSSKYQSTTYSTALPVDFLHPLLRMSIALDCDVRLMVQQTFQALIDRHGNRDKLQKPTIDVASLELNLNLEKKSRTDPMFYKDQGNRILSHLSKSLEMSYTMPTNIEAVYCTTALLCIELASDEALADLISWALTVQDIASTIMLESTHRCLLHAVALSFVVLLADVMRIVQLTDYCTQVVASRDRLAPHLLPTGQAQATDVEPEVPAECLLDFNVISDCLKEAGKNISHIPSRIQGANLTNQRLSWADSSLQQNPSSSTDVSNINLELDSNASSPGMPRKNIEEEVTYEALKKVLTESIESRREAEFEKRQLICDTFKSTPFPQLVASSQAKGDLLNDTLNQILTRIHVVPQQPDPSSLLPAQSLPLYTSNFPDLFVY